MTTIGPKFSGKYVLSKEQTRAVQTVRDQAVKNTSYGTETSTEDREDRIERLWAELAEIKRADEILAEITGDQAILEKKYCQEFTEDGRLVIYTGAERDDHLKHAPRGLKAVILHIFKSEVHKAFTKQMQQEEQQQAKEGLLIAPLPASRNTPIPAENAKIHADRAKLVKQLQADKAKQIEQLRKDLQEKLQQARKLNSFPAIHSRPDSDKFKIN